MTSTIKSFFYGIIIELIHRHLVRKMGEEFIFMGKSIIHGESSKAMVYLEDRSLIVKCRNYVQSRVSDPI